eukprot:m.21487 g.21487  ORF g.21487 m.21487 type:complete len:53 (+) comp8724_c1_seq1:1565-1723(+)
MMMFPVRSSPSFNYKKKGTSFPTFNNQTIIATVKQLQQTKNNTQNQMNEMNE